MNSRERMFAVLSGRMPDVVPVAPCYPNIYLRRYQWQAYVEAYHARLGNRTDYRLSPEEDNQILFESRVKALDAWREMPDWIGVSRGLSAKVQARSVLRARDGDLFLVDEQKGTEINLSELARGGSNELLRDRVDELSASATLTRADVDRKAPVVSRGELLESGVFDVPKRMIERFGDHTFVHSVLSTPYTSAKYVTGFYHMMLMMKSEKSLLHYVVDRCLQAVLEVLEVWAELGVHGVWLQETLSSADLISPEDYDEFVYPTTQQLVRRCQALGMKAILYPCGDIVPRLPRLLEMAPDALAVEESKKGFMLDIAEIRAAVGEQLCLFGNVDAYGVLELGSKEELRDEIRRQLRGGRAERARFIMGIGSPITPGTPPEKVGTFIRMCRELGRYPLRLPSG